MRNALGEFGMRSGRYDGSIAWLMLILQFLWQDVQWKI
jgi:hypothetical protein